MKFKGPVTVQFVQPYVILDSSGRLIKSFQSAHEANKEADYLNLQHQARKKSHEEIVEDLTIKARSGDDKAAKDLVSQLAKEDVIGAIWEPLILMAILEFN